MTRPSPPGPPHEARAHSPLRPAWSCRESRLVTSQSHEADRRCVSPHHDGTSPGALLAFHAASACEGGVKANDWRSDARRGVTAGAAGDGGSVGSPGLPPVVDRTATGTSRAARDRPTSGGRAPSHSWKAHTRPPWPTKLCDVTGGVPGAPPSPKEMSLLAIHTT